MVELKPMFRRFSKLFSQDVGIDLGTANTLVLVSGRGIIIREPTIVAIHKKSKQIVAIGQEAKRMVGRTPASIETVRPLKDGVISDFDITLAMLKYFMKEVGQATNNFYAKSFHLTRPRVVIGIPSGVTEVERRAVQDAALSAGARNAYLIEEPMAAAIGSGLKIEDPEGKMIVDVGGGTTEIAVISLGGIVAGRSIRIAGDELTEDITTYIRSTYGLAIGERTAEELKTTIGNLAPARIASRTRDSTTSLWASDAGGPAKVTKQGKELGHNIVDTQVGHMTIRGRDLTSGLPKQMTISSNDIKDATKQSVMQIVDAVEDCIEDTPPELLADLSEQGIVLAGGGALFAGLDKLIAVRTKLPVTVTEDPLTAVVRGCGMVLEDPSLLEKVKVTGGLR